MAGHITRSVFLPPTLTIYFYCYHNCSNVGSEMVSMVMVAITTGFSYTATNNTVCYSEVDFPDCVVIIRVSVDRINAVYYGYRGFRLVEGMDRVPNLSCMHN